jgi:hypothetical protein
MDLAKLIFNFCKSRCNFLATSTIWADEDFILDLCNLLRYWVTIKVEPKNFFIEALGTTFFL